MTEKENEIKIKKVSKSIISDLNNYDFPDEIKKTADGVYKQISSSVNRRNVRKYLLYFCTYNAYVNLSIVRDPYELGTVFGLNRAGVKKSFSTFSELQTGYKGQIVTYRPTHFIPIYCDEIGIEEFKVKEITEFAEKFTLRHPEIKQYQPQIVAQSFIYYSLEISGINMRDKRILGNLNTISMTINNMIDKIKVLDAQYESDSDKEEN